MVRKGDILSSPTTGETFYFLKTAADTNGRLLEYEIHAQPNAAPLLTSHLHPVQDERIEVLKGEITLEVGRETHRLRAGDSRVIPAGVAHGWRNSGEQTALLLIEVEPAGQHETLIETFCAIAHHPRFFADGKLKPLALAVILDKYPDHLYLSSWSARAQKAAYAALAVADRAQGFLPEYSYWDCVSEGEREVSILLA